MGIFMVLPTTTWWYEFLISGCVQVWASLGFGAFPWLIKSCEKGKTIWGVGEERLNQQNRAKLSQEVLKVVVACDAEGVQLWGCHHLLVQRGEKQNADAVSGCALGNEIFKAQVNPLENYIGIESWGILVKSNASGRKAGWRSPGALHRLWCFGFGCNCWLHRNGLTGGMSWSWFVQWLEFFGLWVLRWWPQRNFNLSEESSAGSRANRAGVGREKASKEQAVRAL